MAGKNDLAPPSRAYLAFILPLGKLIGWLIFLVFGPVRTRGRYRVPRSGGVLVLSNHTSDVDPVVVQLACRRAIHFMAKSELFEMPLLGKVIRIFKAFPVKRGEPDRAAMRRAVELLKIGQAVCVFPEGELSENGDLLPLKPGIALIVRMAGCPVICCGIQGSSRVMPYGKTLPRLSWRTIEVNWGETHEFAKDAETEDIVAWADGQLRMLTDQETVSR